MLVITDLPSFLPPSCSFQFYLYRLFQESEDKPKKLKMEAVRRAFPVSVMSESGIRKVLKQFADFKREGWGKETNASDVNKCSLSSMHA